jgi:hypothetical protein
MGYKESAAGSRRATVGQIRAGLVAPPLFATGLVGLSLLQWHYLRDLGFSWSDHGDSAWPSGLAQGPVGFAQVVNFLVFGILLLWFFSGLRREIRSGDRGRITSELLIAFGASWLLVAFPEDGPPFGEPSTWSGYLHGLGFLGVIVSSVAAMTATGLALRHRDEWRGFTTGSLLAAAGVFFFLFVLVFALELATTVGIYGFFTVVLVWVEALALRLRSVTSQCANFRTGPPFESWIQVAGSAPPMSRRGHKIGGHGGRFRDTLRS